MTSTNALTKRYCELRGWPSACVQGFWGGRRHDLFGIVDTVILRPSWPVLFVQNCSYGSLKAHRDEIDSESLRATREAIVACGAILWLLEWRRRKAKRGGKRMAREWWWRSQTALPGMRWNELSAWQGPFDLYPLKGSRKQVH